MAMAMAMPMAMAIGRGRLSLSDVHGLDLVGVTPRGDGEGGGGRHVAGIQDEVVRLVAAVESNDRELAGAEHLESVGMRLLRCCRDCAQRPTGIRVQ